jgi:hypothetical protein
MNIGRIVAIGCAAFIVLILLLPLANDERPAGTYVAERILESAEAYALSNNGKCARSYHDLKPFFPGGSHQVGGKSGTLPRDPFVLHAYLSLPAEQTSEPNYIVDLQPLVVAELLKGNSSNLEGGQLAGRFAYGSTNDLKNFVIVCFRQNGVPLYRSGMMMVLSNGGELLQAVPKHKIESLRSAKPSHATN